MQQKKRTRSNRQSRKYILFLRIEYNTIAQIKVYNEKIGITACKDINFRHKITELSKNIQNFNDKRKIFKQIIDSCRARINGC